MNKIITELNKYNLLYTLEMYQKNRMNNIELDLNSINLDSCYNYELALNQDCLDLNTYDKLEESIVHWIKVEDFKLTKNELIEFINKRIETNLSIDRIYFFNELIFYYCEQKDKKVYAIKLVNSLKNCLSNKLKNNIEIDLLLRLLARFLIISERFKLEDKIFIKEIVEEYLCKLNVENDFYISMYFYECIFDKFNKNSYFYSLIVSTFEKFANKIDLELINNGYSPYLEYGSNLAKIFEKMNNYVQKIYFYKKEIDNAITQSSDISENTINIQSYLQDIANISKKTANYKLSDIKLLSKKVSNYISCNYDKFFIPIKNEDLGKKNLEYFKSMEKIYNKRKYNKDKIDFIVFETFHESFSEEAFIKHKKNEKKREKGLFTSFFPSKIMIDHKGFSYNIRNKDIFSFFQFMPSLQNSLFVYLDYYEKWISTSKNIMLENIKKLKLIEDNYKNQFNIVINSFCNEDYVQFMYIAPSLIELILKKYLEKLEGDLLSLTGDSFTEKTMSQIISVLISDENSYLDKFILEYISYVMISKEGLNLRNNIAHGNFSDYAFNKTNAMYLYIILIYLIVYFVNDERE